MSAFTLPLSLDERARDPAHWPTLRQLLLSDQVPASRLEELLRDHPPFAAWMRAEAERTAKSQPEPRP